MLGCKFAANTTILFLNTQPKSKPKPLPLPDPTEMACTTTFSPDVAITTARSSVKRPLVFDTNPTPSFGSSDILALAETATLSLVSTVSTPKACTRPQPLNAKPKSQPQPRVFTVPLSRVRTRGVRQAAEETPKETLDLVQDYFTRAETDRKHWETSTPDCAPGTVLGQLPRALWGAMFAPCPVRAAMGDRTDAYAVEVVKAAEATRNQRLVQTCVYCKGCVWGARAGMTIHYDQCPHTPWNRPGFE